MKADDDGRRKEDGGIRTTGAVPVLTLPVWNGWVSLACGYAGCIFLSETVKVT